MQSRVKKKLVEDFMMRAWLIIFSVFTTVFLSGCTTAPTVVRSEVTAFHEWPANLQNDTFTFDPAAEQQNNLEYRAYASFIREELQRLGFRTGENPAAADLRVRFQYGITARDVRIVEPMMVDPGFPLFSPYGARYGPYYDPFWHPGYVDRYETQYVLYTRRLHITISRASTGRNLYDVTVVSEGRKPNLASVMPYMVKSAFSEFPGPNGVPRRIELTMDEDSGKIQPAHLEEIPE